MMSNSYPGPSGSGSLADTLTLDALDELCSAQGRGEFKAWLLDKIHAGALCATTREVPVLNLAMVRTFKPGGASVAGSTQDTDLFGRSLSVTRSKPASLTRATLPTTEYRVTKQELARVAAEAHAGGWWSESLQLWAGGGPNPQRATVDLHKALSRREVESRLGSVYGRGGEALAWKSVWERISSKSPEAKTGKHDHYELSRVEAAISAMGYTCKTGGLARGVPNSVFNLTAKTAANGR